MKKKQIIVAIIVAVLVLGTAVYWLLEYGMELFAGEKTELAEVQPECTEDEGPSPGDKDTETPFRVLIPAEGDDKPEGLYQASKERLEKLADAPLIWEYMNGNRGFSSLKKRIEAGKYPEIVLGKLFTAADISKYAEKGALLPLEEYINETDTPNIWKLYQERPDVRAASVARDGHIYTLPAVKEFVPDYMDGAIWINKTWLEKLNLRVPKTLQELKKVLVAFRDGDPNGNGIQDEIPLTFCPGHEQSYPEVLLSAFGMTARPGSTDFWLTAQKDRVVFAPVTNEWKEMIVYYRDLYREGLLDPEAFDHDDEEFLAKQQAETSIIGVVWAQENPMLNREEYVAISPLSAGGKRKPVWGVNAKYSGSRDVFCIFKSCKNPGAALRWADKLYQQDQSIRNAFGEEGENGLFTIEEGNFLWNSLPEEVLFEDYLFQCVLTGGMPCYLPHELYGSESLPLREEWKERMEISRMYEPYLEDAPWPRPYYSPEEKETLTELSADISILVKVKLEGWIIDKEDLETDWGQYQADLVLMGLDKALAIHQEAYDRYRTGMSQ